ncbi:YlmC/YmxH family sporulation protein [Oceanobacillus bengalensis]|uniref:YlmC/YmxH family sporulation protein n=1 Tax=Oceanobacillus bengalensis TaxID=1435466 RepID=A0A494Z1H3_9BACI|nr:YlmC/YmxH family sporulation protein [Oceanobacillus bengalensis]RKQ16298.1 YlmC/YmxH family sporulation protein [Oceanobacillus bengalensis]
MVTLSELQLKEVILIEDGRRLGNITDLDINPDTGKIEAIIIMVKDKKGSLFSKADELIVGWNQIVRIGSDVILVREAKGPLLLTQT